MSHLIETLQHMQKRPEMYFGDGARAHSIHVLQAFILGFETGQQSADTARDFDCFREWVGMHYRALVDGQSGFDLVLEHVGGDAKAAFDEFFRLLPAYISDRQQMGRERIRSRFGEIQEELWEKFRTNLKNE